MALWEVRSHFTGKNDVDQGDEAFVFNFRMMKRLIDDIHRLGRKVSDQLGVGFLHHLIKALEKRLDKSQYLFMIRLE